MAIDYDSGSGLFDKVGVVVSLTNALETFETSTSSGNLEKEMQDLEAKLDDTKQFDRIARDLMYQKWSGYKSALDQMKVQLTELTRLFMASEICIQDGFDKTDASSLAEYLRFAMIRDSEDVDANAVAGAVWTLDNSRLSIFTALDYAGYGSSGTSQEDAGDIRADTVRAVVTDVQTPYSEKIQFQGTAVLGSLGHPNWEYLGTIGQYTAFRFKETRNIIVDPGFEQVDGNNKLQRWSAISGTEGTDFESQIGDNFDGSRSLLLTNNCRLSQVIPRSKFKPYTTYFLIVAVATDTTPDGTLNVEVSLEGGSGLVVDPGTAYPVLQAFPFATGESILTDPTIQIILAGQSTGDWKISNVGLFEAIKLTNNAYVLPIRNPDGTTRTLLPLRLGKSGTRAFTNDHGGLFQTYFSRFFNILLPGDSGGTESISDTLAA